MSCGPCFIINDVVNPGFYYFTRKAKDFFAAESLGHAETSLFPERIYLQRRNVNPLGITIE